MRAEVVLASLHSPPPSWKWETRAESQIGAGKPERGWVGEPRNFVRPRVFVCATVACAGGQAGRRIV